jgi:hypothetical protein
MLVELEVNVSQEDIEKANHWREMSASSLSHGCPVALAVSRAIARIYTASFVSVGLASPRPCRDARLVLPGGDGKNGDAKLPESACDFIAAFDAYQKVEPFKFSVWFDDSNLTKKETSDAPANE